MQSYLSDTSPSASPSWSTTAVTITFTNVYIFKYEEVDVIFQCHNDKVHMIYSYCAGQNPPHY